MATLYMTKGLPGSGKTTWAKSSGVSTARVNKDDLRAMLHNGQHSKSNERDVIELRNFIVNYHLSKGESVIVDDTNFNPAHEATLRDFARDHGAKFEIKDFTDVSLATCLERNRNRKDKDPVPERVIRQMHDRYIRPTRPLPTYDNSLQPCVIVDLDGTLAHRSTDRSPFDWHRVGEDTVDELVRAVLWSFGTTTDNVVIILSGRDEVCRPETVAWLEEHIGSDSYEHLFMRPANDNRKDSVVKRELFEQHILGNYYPALVLDDRNQVVDMWREELGLTVWQVAQGDF